MPRVVTNGGMPSATISSPLAIRKVAPTPTADTSAVTTLLPLASCIASTTPARPSTAPIDRPNPSLMMINVIGSASSSSVDDWMPMLRRFATDMKLGSSTENDTNRPASRYATPGIAAARANRAAGLIQCTCWQAGVTKRGMLSRCTTPRLMHREPQDVLLAQLIPAQLADDGLVAHHV